MKIEEIAPDNVLAYIVLYDPEPDNEDAPILSSAMVRHPLSVTPAYLRYMLISIVLDLIAEARAQEE